MVLMYFLKFYIFLNYLVRGSLNKAVAPPVPPLLSLKPELMSDTVISCDGKEFPAHRLVLSGNYNI